METKTERFAENEGAEDLTNSHKCDGIPLLVHMTMEDHEDEIESEYQTQEESLKITIISLY